MCSFVSRTCHPASTTTFLTIYDSHNLPEAHLEYILSAEGRVAVADCVRRSNLPARLKLLYGARDLTAPIWLCREGRGRWTRQRRKGKEQVTSKKVIAHYLVVLRVIFQQSQFQPPIHQATNSIFFHMISREGVIPCGLFFSSVVVLFDSLR